MVDIRQGHHAVAEEYVGVAAALRRRKIFFGGLAAGDSRIGGNQLQDTRVHRSADGGGPVVKQLRNGLELADELPSGDRAIFDGAFDRASNLAVARVAFEPEHIAPLRDREEEFYDRVIRGGQVSTQQGRVGAFSSSPYELAQACMQDTNSFCYCVLMTTPVAMCNRALND